ncbi:MAG: BrnA antitoxin family protein [Lachnospiraceae bacterium]|nr:BrnA antitoxin family protein [Lachnospiraceae bacterium]
MKKTIKVEKLGDITEKQLMEIEKAKRHDIVFDEDSPEITEEMMEQFRRVAKEKREERQKQVLTLRVSAETMKKAKSLGKGYTGILSRILEYALNDPEIIRRCL